LFLEKPICAVPGCGRVRFVRDYCNPHHQRLTNTGDVQPDVPIRRVAPRKKPCTVEGCERARTAHGWCDSHYARWKKTGDVQADVPIGGRGSRRGTCRVEGCGKPIDARRLCNAHMVREDKWGDVMAHIPIKQRSNGRCSVPNCEGEHAGLGWCRYHYEPFKRYKLTPDDFDALMARQGGGCAICGAKPGPGARLHVDHDHLCCPGRGRSCGKCVRGLLCVDCNVMIGLAKDDTSTLRAAIAYLDARSRALRDPQDEVGLASTG
jgi:hypothetical protein